MSILRHLPYAILSAGLLAGGSASAQSMWSIDAREAQQQERIEQGRRNGSLTREEYNRLERGQDRIESYERRARADGVVTPYERSRLDGMLDQQGRQIYRETHDNERAGWSGRNGRQDGWNNGRHEGWTRGEHNGWDGNRPQGIERRDARLENRIDNGRRDGSLTTSEANRLQYQQNRIDRYEGRARADGNVSPHERNRIDNMQNQQSRDIYNARHNDRTATPPAGTQPGGPRTWNGGGQPQQASNAPPTTPPAGTQTGGMRTGGGNWQAHAPQPATSTSAAQPAGGNARWAGNGGGWSMRPAATTPPSVQPTMTRTTGSSGSGRRH